MASSSSPTSVLAMAGAIGVVLAFSLLILAVLAWRWQSVSRGYVRTATDSDTVAVEPQLEGERQISA